MFEANVWVLEGKSPEAGFYLLRRPNTGTIATFLTRQDAVDYGKDTQTIPKYMRMILKDPDRKW